MVAQRQLTTRSNFIFQPTGFDDAMKFATMIASSGLCPENVRGKPEDVFIILQTGAEMGLKSMQALRTLGVINGMPFAYGDGLLAQVKKHPDFIDMKEWFEGSIADKNLTAYCTMERKNEAPTTKKFSMQDAITAGLWNKTYKSGQKSTWTLYPERMLMHRARTYCSKDKFPEAVMGLCTEDEIMEIIEVQEVKEAPKIKGKGISGLEETLGLTDDNIIDVESTLSEPTKLDGLKELISRLKVTKGSVTVTLKKCGVDTLEQLSDEQIDKWSNHLKNKEIK